MEELGAVEIEIEFNHENLEGKISVEHSNFGFSKEAAKDSFKPQKKNRNLDLSS